MPAPRLPLILLALAALAPACATTGGGVAPGPRTGASKAPLARAGSPSPAASARPIQVPLVDPNQRAGAATSEAGASSPQAQPTPWPEAWPRLSPAAGAFQGQVKLDAAYLVGQGAGLIANNGAALVGPRGDSLLADPAIGLLSNHGGGLISNNGGSLISNNGGSAVVSPYRGGLLALGRGLFQADAAASSSVAEALPALGTQLTVGGMMVTPVSLTDGKALGPPVLTDAEGRFRFDLPNLAVANLRLDVAPPPQATAKAQADARLRYPTLAAASIQVGGVPIDEDTAQAGLALAGVFRNQVRALLVTTDVAGIMEQIGLSLDGASGPLVMGTLEGIRQKALAVGYPGLSEAKQVAIADRIGDLLLSDVDLAGTQINPTNTGYTGPGGPALPALLDTMKALREGATVLLRQNPKAFEKAPFVEDGTASRAARGLPPVVILRPSDWAAYAGELVLSDVTPGSMSNLDPMLAFVNQGELVDRVRRDGSIVKVNGIRLRHTAAANGMLLALGAEMVKKKAQVEAILAEPQ